MSRQKRCLDTGYRPQGAGSGCAWVLHTSPLRRNHTVGLICPSRLSLTDHLLLVAPLCLSSPEALLLSSALFLWQFPHFFALSWVHRKDYARGGFQMVPCNDPTGTRTADLILRYACREEGGGRKRAWLGGMTGAIILPALQWRLPIWRPADSSYAAFF